MTTPGPARLGFALALLVFCASPPLVATASAPDRRAPIANGSGPPLVYLPTADATALVSGDADRTVRDAFLGPDAPGALLVRGVPGYAEARVEALRSLALCAASPKGRSAFVEAEQWESAHGGDAFTKQSVAADAHGRLPPALDAACGADLRPKLEALRAAADAVASAVLPRLDVLLGYDTQGFFAEAAASGGSLDHFHVYARKRSQSSAREAESSPEDGREGHSGDSAETLASLEDARESDARESDARDPNRPGWIGKSEHVDVGVAIVMTPAFLLPNRDDVSNLDSGIDLDDEVDARGARGLTLGGRVPELPPDSVILVLGEAARAWVPPPPKGVAVPEIAVPSHEMSLDLHARFVGTGSAAKKVYPSSRAWFGRMVLPSNDRVHPSLSTTFGAWRDGVAAAFANDDGGDDASFKKQRLSLFSCSPRRKLADDSSCPAGKIYCWLSCVDEPTGGCSAGEEAKCVEPSTKKLWPDDLGAESHCYTCRPTCVTPAATPEASSSNARAGGSTNAFCNDKIAPVSMYMDGFLGWSDPDGPCVAFLHRDLMLTSPGLLFAAFSFTVAVGVAVEGLAAARRWRAKTQDAVCLDAIATGGNPSAVSAVLKTQSLLLYGVQCSAGYLLMLVSMTYHAVLFVGVVLGLVAGHAWFNAAAPLGSRGGASACCQHVGTVAEGGDPWDDGRARDSENEALDARDGGSSGDGCADDTSSLDGMHQDLLAKRRGSSGRGLELGVAGERRAAAEGPERV